MDRQATRATAADEYRVGENLIRHKRLHDAIEHLRTAATLDREKPVYTVALAQAVLAEGRAADAEQMLIPLLERDTMEIVPLHMALHWAQENEAVDQRTWNAPHLMQRFFEEAQAVQLGL